MDRTEFRCSLCSTIIGRNLRGEYPFALERQHMQIHAAAPALLEALEAAETRLRVYAEWADREIIASRGTNLMREIRNGARADAQDARAAIAQAKGESND